MLAFLSPLTFVAVPDCVKVNVILLIGEEEKAEPRVEGVDGDYEEDPHDVPLFIRRAVVTQVHVDLNKGREQVKCNILLCDHYLSVKSVHHLHIPIRCPLNDFVTVGIHC